MSSGTTIADRAELAIHSVLFLLDRSVLLLSIITIILQKTIIIYSAKLILYKDTSTAISYIHFEPFCALLDLD